MSCNKSDTIWFNFNIQIFELFFLNLKILEKFPVNSQKIAEKLDFCDDVIIGPNTPPPPRHQSSSFANPLPPLGDDVICERPLVVIGQNITSRAKYYFKTELAIPKTEIVWDNQYLIFYKSLYHVAFDKRQV